MDEENNKPIIKNETGENFIDLDVVPSTEDGEELPTKDVTKKLREEIKKLQKEKEDYLTGWQRAKADYVNLQKELENSKISTSVLAKEKMMQNFISVLDSFDMAFSHKESWDKVDPEWKKGIENIHQQFISALNKSGIEKIDQEDVSFDPYIHQSIQILPTDDESKDHYVAKVLQTGYKIGDSSNSSNQARVIRPAKVIIYEYKNE